MTEVPLKSYEFRREREASWRELESLVGKAEAGGIRALTAAEAFRLPTLYRATLSSLSVARSISLDRNVVGYLENLSARAYFFVYGARASFAAAALDFFRAGFPRIVREMRHHVMVAGLVMALGFVAGLMLTLDSADWFYSLVSADMAQGRTPTSTTADLRRALYDGQDSVATLYHFATFLFTHNAKIGLLCFALGFALGIPVIVLLFHNGLILGAFAAVYGGRGLSVEFWAWILVHGGTELLAVVLCGGAGLALGAGIAFPGRHSRLENLAIRGRTASLMTLGAVAMLFVAGLLEGLARQLVTDPTTRYVIAGAALAFWTWYFLRAGRAPEDGRPG